ncbi:hypothetical protein [Nitratireductor soli]|uniref:hypothetical protein n=1 Tax=Nitratireductor soli TaxID=1670619 RepID=UPI00065DD561|nr:hypothetical protein [Nitratireductor soli]
MIRWLWALAALAIIAHPALASAKVLRCTAYQSMGIPVDMASHQFQIDLDGTSLLLESSGKRLDCRQIDTRTVCFNDDQTIIYSLERGGKLTAEYQFGLYEQKAMCVE